MRPRGSQRGAACLLRALVLAALVAGSSSAWAQESPEINLELGTVDLNTLSTIYPGFLFRPIDDLTPRMGGRAQGMAGAYLALATGPEALSWNPAGLAFAERASLATDFYSNQSSGSTTGFPVRFGQDIPSIPPIFVAQYDENLKTRIRFGFLGLAGTAFRLAGRPVHLGGAFRRHTNVTYPEEIVSELQFVEGTTTVPVIFANDNEESGAIEAVTLGAAYEVVPGFALGASANYLTGRYRSDFSTLVNVPGAGGQAAGSGTFGLDYKGVSVELGARAQMGRLSLAGWVGLPHTVEVTNGDYRSRDLEAPGVPIITTTATLGGYDLDVPLFFSAGAAFDLSDRLTVAADFNSRPWGDATLVYLDDEVASLPNASDFYPASDVQSFHAGVEYLLARGNGFSLPVRAGFAYLPLSMANADPNDLLDTNVTIITELDEQGNVIGFEQLGGDGDPAFYGEDQVNAFAWAFGGSLVLEDVTFHTGFEARRYSFDRLFFESSGRGTSVLRDFLINPDGNVGQVDRLEVVLRFSAELRL